MRLPSKAEALEIFREIDGQKLIAQVRPEDRRLRARSCMIAVALSKANGGGRISCGGSTAEILDLSGYQIDAAELPRWMSEAVELFDSRFPELDLPTGDDAFAILEAIPEN